MNKDPKKVCLLGISLGIGGASRAMAMQSQMLVDSGFQVHIVILVDRVDYDYAGTLFNLGKNVNDDTMSKRLKRFKTLRTYLKKQNFDVVVDHRPKNDFVRELYYHKYLYKNINTIYVVHSARQKTYLSNHPNLISRIYNRNKTTVAVSKHIKRQLEALGINKVSCIPNGFDDRWQQMAGNVPKVLSGKSYVLAYGRLDDSVKDYSFLLKAFETSKLWESGKYLVILGDGKDREILKSKASKLNCKDFVMFLPFINSPFGHVAHSKFVALTSRFEGFPMVLIESLSLGTPVVSLDIPSGPSEVVVHRKNGLLVKKRDVHLFAEHMRLMYEDEALYDVCKQNTRPSIEQYSKEKIVEQWQKILNS